MSWRAGLAKVASAVAVLALVSTASFLASPSASASTITFTPPTGSIDVAGSTAFTQQLTASGNVSAVTYVQDLTNQSPDLTITGGGLVSVVGGPLGAGTYSITGSASDTSGDSGTWGFSLTVSPDTFTSSPTSDSTDVAGSTAFTQQLTPQTENGSPVTYIQGTNNQSPDLTITGGGLVAVADGPLDVGAYSISGTSSDGLNDTGTWDYSLTVTPDTIVQGSPTSGNTNTNSSSSFSTTLSATSGFVGAVTFATTSPGFTISNGNELESTGSLSAGGSPYAVTGTDLDADGDTGTWTYSLTVTASVGGGGGGGGGGTTSINQTSPTTGTVLDTSSGTFSTGPITDEGGTGPVTFVTTKANADLTVSDSGLITTTRTLPVGTYTDSGTDSDTHGDTGTWTYTLTVTATIVTVTVTFDANGGTGTMASESASAPTALSLNHFVRKGYTFVDWNTSANGSGVSYANGAVFHFTTATTLFAHWRRGKAPARTITFAGNGGAGITVSEIEDTPTAIRANHFSRRGFTFIDWNTRADGKGTRFEPGATYRFKDSITLYAQWKKIPKAPPPKPSTHDVIFVANGGAGAMAVETHRGAATLTPDHFTRTGYTFLDWNTAANGKGISYANGARYPFSASTNLYAQWKKNKVVPPPTSAIPGGVIIGPFAQGSTSLTSTLESEIRSLALGAKSGNDKLITLYGFGDGSAASAANTALGRERVGVVATYLEARLAASGLKGWTISIATASPSASEVASVVVTLS
jgi:uncharacterized repeat protein (TIGR02543 family)